MLRPSAKEGEHNTRLEPDYMMINGYSAPFADVFFLVNNPKPSLTCLDNCKTEMLKITPIKQLLKIQSLIRTKFQHI